MEGQSQHVVERWTRRALRAGVWSSAGFLVCGLAVTAVRPAPPRIVGSFAAAFSAGGGWLVDGTSLLYAGLLILMLTPFLRVLTAVTGFAAERDWRYAAVALAVFAMLLAELFLSFQ